MSSALGLRAESSRKYPGAPAQIPLGSRRASVRFGERSSPQISPRCPSARARGGRIRPGCACRLLPCRAQGRFLDVRQTPPAALLPRRPGVCLRGSGRPG